MSVSAFGVDHGEIDKGLKDVAQTAKLHGKIATGSFKLGRLHGKKALAEAGYPTTMRGNLKESFKAGMRGKPAARAYKSGAKSAQKAGRARTMDEIGALTQGRRRSPIDPGMANMASARFNRGLSRQDWRLR